MEPRRPAPSPAGTLSAVNSGSRGSAGTAAVRRLNVKRVADGTARCTLGRSYRPSVRRVAAKRAAVTFGRCAPRAAGSGG